ncbi:MAG: PAAR domain-containing protein [Spirochaetaceae bacterium]|nr:PAAR domain-containing protein [Spirochaetaceae bacterium]
MIDSPFICFGDKTTCGGVVAQGNPTCDVHGIPVSFATARIACRKNCIIVGGDPTEILDGHPIASFLLSTSNGGCKFVPSQRTTGDARGSSVGAATTPIAAGVVDAVIPIMEDMQELLDPPDFVELRLQNQRQESIANEPFKLTAPDGQVVEGSTDANGQARVDGVPRGDLTLPPKNVSLAECFNASKENGNDEDDKGAVHAGVQAGGCAIGRGWAEHRGGGAHTGRGGTDPVQLGQGQQAWQAQGR